MLLHFRQNDLPQEVMGRPDVRTWTATDPQLELWAVNQETWYIRFQDPARATMFVLKYPDVTEVVDREFE